MAAPVSGEARPAATRPAFAGLAVGHVVATKDVAITRDTLVRYAGASGDFNPIHYNDVFAVSVGLPGVIAHGMFTMGAAASVVESWAGPGNVVDFQTRFSRPIAVPNPGEAVAKVHDRAIQPNAWAQYHARVVDGRARRGREAGNYCPPSWKHRRRQRCTMPPKAGAENTRRR